MLDVVDEVVSNIHAFGWGRAEISVGCRRILTDIIGMRPVQKNSTFL
jgi:hypothetical protein